MIRNLIFDMGNVLLDYQPDAYVGAFLKSEADRDLVLGVLFGSEEWEALDRGRVTEREALSVMLQKLPERLHEEARALFYGWHHYTKPIGAVNELAVRLHEAGYKLYLLSNTGVRLHVYAHRLPALKVFDGRVYSADVQEIKPEPQIYQILFETYGLDPAECLFIDDREENLEAGEALGMQGCLFDGDVDRLEKNLSAFGVAWDAPNQNK